MADFSDEQQQVIDLPASARVLVDAAAGTGKTHTLVGRLSTLVDRDGLCAGDDLLVLSFSRAAVAELRRRVGGLVGDTRYVGASTFDSFATRMLAAADPDGLWSTADHDSRVRAAVRRLDQHDASWDELDGVRHILIDEIQDLVGPRADLVVALLGRVQCGFTLFGDPAQAIYGHRTEGTTERTNAELYVWLRDHFRGSLDTRSLTHNHRAATPQTAEIAILGDRLRGDDPDQAAIASQIRTVLLELPVATPATARRMLIRPSGLTSAVLTRTNGEALLLSRNLHEEAVPHRLQRRGEDKAAAAWLSEVVVGLDTRTSRTSLEDRLEALAHRLELSSEGLYRLMRLMDPRHGNEIDLRRVADCIRLGNIPEELNEVVPASVVVSTIHRSKGLEFDRVLMGDPSEGHGERDQGEENRIIYVGLSRACREIWHVDTPRAPGLTLHAPTGRWVRRGFGADRWKAYDVEIGGGDVHALHPAGAWLIEADVLDTQYYMRSDVTPGDPVELVLVREVEAADPAAYYSVVHAGRPIGVTSEAFSNVLHRVLGGRENPRWPTRIDSVYVELVDTVAGHESVGRQSGIGGHGLWARVRVAGLGALTFNVSAEGK